MIGIAHIFYAGKRYMRIMVTTLINKCYIKINGGVYGNSLCVDGLMFVRNYGVMCIGNNVRINSCIESNPIYHANKTCLLIGSDAKLTICDNVKISNTCICCMGEDVLIKDNVFIGAGCCIYTTDFHSISPVRRNNKIQAEEYIKKGRVMINESAFIGAGCIVLKNVCIGKNAVVGANSVVTKDIPANEVWAGNPAVFIKKIESEE